MSDFRKLKVYSKSLEFASAAYDLCKKFPKEEQYALSSQFKKAATSICLNIAEGSGRHSKKDFGQFLRIALGSALECSSLLDIALKLLFISKPEHDNLVNDCNEIGKMLNGLIASLTNN